MKVKDCKFGQVVSFGRPSGEKTLGKIVKVNCKSIKVKVLETRGTRNVCPVGAVWRVHPSLVVLVEAKGTGEG